MKNELYFDHPLKQNCRKFLSRHKPLSQRAWMERILNMEELDLDIDRFGHGPAISILEQKLANILGKEKAMFFHKGMVGQLCALKYWCYRSSCNSIAIHPQSHIHNDEELAYKELLGLKGYFLGGLNEAFDSKDIYSLPARLGAISVELPVRRAGFALPNWECLLKLRAYCNDTKIPLHIDGARLFEAAYELNKTCSEVANLADSLYVSLYKILGAMGGGVLAGSEQLIEGVGEDKSRFGGDINTVFPYVISALWGLQHHFPRISTYCENAHSLAAILKEQFEPKLNISDVQGNAFVIEFPFPKSVVASESLEIASRNKTWLFDSVLQGRYLPTRVEVQIGDAFDEWNESEVIDVFYDLVSRCERQIG